MHIKYITDRTGFVLQSFTQVARKDWDLSSGALSIIYDGLYIPIITYACGTWGWAINKTHIKRKLISSQRKALLLITKAFRTASNSSIQVLAKKPPIDLSILQRRKLLRLKWGEPVQTRTRLITTNDVEWYVPFCDTPSPDNFIIGLSTFIQKTQLHIFTDGSKINDSIGCSFVVYNSNNHELYNQIFRLDNYCTVFQAELIAIKMCIHWVHANYINTTTHIYTDSLSANSLINSTKLHPIAEDIRNLIRHSNSNFIITWVRAHQGLIGNERADQLAKLAATDNSIPIIYNKLSQGSVKRILWEDTLNT
ncbi:uncharacterized protein LOC111619173 [Centruroides sculpturatus]|uniref:uncharacterized protein LOC111619173 n=1 Tax=Centruroides sculpturatus TaxID=218467 RepID=UPI000C6DCAB6|nr:uncharacterized protein LOC111619173 [Centruroides sculpturatus]